MSNILIENKEAIYFKSPEECFKKCCYYLNNPIKAKDIANKGKIKITKILKLNHENLMKQVIKRVLNYFIFIYYFFIQFENIYIVIFFSKFFRLLN